MSVGCRTRASEPFLYRKRIGTRSRIFAVKLAWSFQISLSNPSREKTKKEKTRTKEQEKRENIAKVGSDTIQTFACGATDE